MTPQQAALLRFLDEWYERFDYGPSYLEMMGALGMKSKAEIHRLVNGLEERGKIIRIPFRARSVRPASDPIRNAVDVLLACAIERTDDRVTVDAEAFCRLVDAIQKDRSAA